MCNLPSAQCRDSPCGPGRCRNTPGHYSCSCHPGHGLDPATRTCRDMDECAADNGGCGQLCANTPGSRTCRSDSQWTIGPVPWPMFPNGCLFSCRPGYRCVDPECLVCEDEDECGPGGRGSGCGQLCVNTPGSYHCACLPGELCLVSTCPSVLQIICLSSPPCKL